MLYIDTREAIKQIRKDFKQSHGRSATNSVYNKAFARALNHTARKAKTQTIREIRNEYKIKAKTIRPTLSLRRATTNQQQARIIAVGARLPLKHFGARQTKRGVSVNIKGQRKLLKGSFMASMAAGANTKTGVFARGRYEGGEFKYRQKRNRKPTAYRRVKGKLVPVFPSDLPITELKTVSVPTAMQQENVLEALSQKINSDLGDRLRHELSRLLRVK